MILEYDAEKVNIYIVMQSYTLKKHCIMCTVSCDDGDLRLVGGETEYEGLLEVCFSQRWGTVNGDGWSVIDTQVACRQLGFDAVGK